MTAPAYPQVLSPARIGAVELRNRVFVSAHTTNFGVDFLPTARHVAYHRERARGGVGMIVVEPLRVHETSLGRAGGLGADRAALPVLTELVEAVRDEGAACLVQITHAGRHSENGFRRTASWGPSDVPWDASGQTPHAMTRHDMVQVREGYVAAALLARDAGFQGVEVHLGHGHLLHQFISPASNTRTDGYGGSADARLRFPLEVLDAVVDAVGHDLVVGVRTSADELLPGGQDLAAGVDLAARVTSTRPVGFVSVSLASYTSPSIGHHVADMSEGRTPYLQDALAVAAACGEVPVLMACRVVDLDDAERVLTTGRFTAVAMTRAHIADPHLVRKHLEGRGGQVRPCVSCNFCIGEIAVHRPISCMVNPVAGREAALGRLEPAGEPRRVDVVGAGPAGMEVAAVAAERGHRVRLLDRAPRTGGQLTTGRRGRGRADLDLLRQHQEQRLAASGVEVRLGTEVDAATLAADAPDVVVVATGADRSPGELAGWGPCTGVRGALDGSDRTGRVVVVVDDEGSWATASVAETLAASGAVVHVVAAAGTLLPGVTEYSRMTAVERLRRLGVQLWTGTVATFERGAATLRPRLLDLEHHLEHVDEVVHVRRPAARAGLADDLEAAGVPVVLVGDALAPRNLLDAVHEGHLAGRRV